MKKHKVELDVLRVIAIVLVVYNHTQWRGFELFLYPGVSSINYIASLLLAILCKVAVPIFFMISGGLLLGKQEAVRTVIRKRVLRMVCVLVLFSAAVYLFQIHWGYVENASLVSFLSVLYHDGVNRPYWFLYAYLSLMLMLPLLRPLVQNIQCRTWHYLIVLHLICHMVLIPAGALAGWGTLHENFVLSLAEPVCFYFLLGYYMEKVFPWNEVTGKRYGMLVLVSAADVLLAGIVLTLGKSVPGLDVTELIPSFMLFPVLSVYIGICWFCRHHVAGPAAAKMWSILGECVFGVYLTESIYRGVLSGIYDALEPHIHVLPACMVFVAAVLAACFITSAVLRKIPILRRLL